MRKYTRFINSDYLFATTAIDANVDPKLLEKFIDQAQEINIQQVLGNALYTKLMADAYDDNVQGEYLNLLRDYVLVALANWSLYHAMPFINYKLTNKSIAERSSEDSQATELSVVNYLRENVRNTAEFFTQRVRDFIVNNPGDFPEYHNTTGQGLRPKSRNYFGGIFLDGNCGTGNDCDCGPNPVIRLT